MKNHRSGLPGAAVILVAAALLVPALGSCAAGSNDGPRSARPTISQAPEPLADARLLGLGPKQGEYGLWVRLDGDSLRASWITGAPGPGFLEVEVSGSSADVEVRLHSTGVAHAGAMEMPPGDQVRLRYGSADDPSDRHETVVRLRDEVRPPVVTRGLDSIYVIGDIHGQYENMVAVLGNAGLIGDRLEWTGGTHHLVVLGDMMSRGSHPTAVLWFLYRLEREAEAAGGKVHIVLGNHEFMVLMDDLRYVQNKESRIAEVHGIPYHRMFDPRHSVLGKWLVSKPVAIQIDDVVMAHGGLGAEYQTFSMEALDDSVARWTGEETFYRWADDAFWEDPPLVLPMDSVAWNRRLELFFEPTSPIWHREYAQTRTAGDELQNMLDRHRARVHVIGHTPMEAIHQRYGGRVILTNTFPFAAEMLLLVRDPEGLDGWARHRIGFEGPPQPLQTLF
jgi:hypothetical protein